LLFRQGWKWLAGRVACREISNDPWSTLRQLYAGPRAHFLFFFVVVFWLPYVGRASFYSTVSAAEQRVIDAWQHQKDHWREPHRALAGSAAEVVRTPFDGAEDWFRRHAKPRPLWHVLLKWDEGKLWPTVLAVALIVYNIGVYWLITSVGPLRDEEERSGWSPAWKDYGYLRWVHRVVTFLFYVSVLSFLWNVWVLLNEVVWVPAGG
jgi:hypothetical protein